MGHGPEQSGACVLNLKEWNNAAESYENVLEVYPEFRPAYERARSLEHDVLFNYQRAFMLNESWLQRNPDDLAAIASLAETYFTTGDFDECARRISSLLADNRFDEKTKSSLRALEIANLIALSRSAEVPARVKDLIETIESRGIDFRVQSSFAGIEHFIRQSKLSPAQQAWLLQFFAAMSRENRDAIVKELKAVAASFTPN